MAGFFGIFLFLCFHAIFSDLPVFSHVFPATLVNSSANKYSISTGLGFCYSKQLCLFHLLKSLRSEYGLKRYKGVCFAACPWHYPMAAFFLHPFQQIITEKTGCLCLADLRIAYKVDHLPADLFLQCPAHDVGMRVQGIGIVIANVDGFVVKEKCADDTFIRCFRKNVDLPSGREEVLVDMVTKTIVGTAFADDGLPVQIVILV